MARFMFGGGPEDVYMTVDSTTGFTKPVGGKEAKFYSDQAMTDRITDLQTTNGAPLATVLTQTGTDPKYAVGQIAPLYGPDNVPEMWCSVDGSPPFLLQASDLGEKLGPVPAALASHVAEKNGHSTRLFDMLDVDAYVADPVGSYLRLEEGTSGRKWKARPFQFPEYSGAHPDADDGAGWYRTDTDSYHVMKAGTVRTLITDADNDGGGGGPTKPGEMLTLSKWELTLPVGGDGGDPNNPLDIYAPTLTTFEHPQFFKIVTDGSGVKCVEFVAPVKGVTTSTESGSTRSELREMGSANGGSSGPKASWQFNDNTEHDLIVTMTSDPTGIVNGRKEIIVGQIHGAADSPIPIILAVDFNTLPGKLQLFKNGTKTGAGDILTDLTATTRFTYRIQKTAGGSSSRMRVSAALGNKSALPATPQFDFPISDFSDTNLYFKAGCYLKEKTNTSATGSGKTRIYAMSLDGVGYVVPGTSASAPIGAAPTTGAWVDLAVADNVISRDGYPNAGVRVEGTSTARRVHCRGGLQASGSVASGAVLATVPEGYRPEYTVTLAGRFTTGTAILTINPLGEVRLGNSLTAGAWVTLDNAQWYI